MSKHHVDLRFFASLYWPGFGHGNFPRLAEKQSPGRKPSTEVETSHPDRPEGSGRKWMLELSGKKSGKQKGGSMRSLSGASLTLGSLGLAATIGCSQVGMVQARRDFKAANAAYQQQDYKKAAELYEQTLKRGPVAYRSVLFPRQQLRQPVQAQPARRRGQRRAPRQGGQELPDGGRQALGGGHGRPEEAREALPRVSPGRLRRRQAERSGEGRTDRPEDDSARAGRTVQLLRPRQDL